MILATTEFASQIKIMAACINFKDISDHFSLMKITPMCNTANLYYL